MASLMEGRKNQNIMVTFMRKAWLVRPIINFCVTDR